MRGYETESRRLHSLLRVEEEEKEEVGLEDHCFLASSYRAPTGIPPQIKQASVPQSFSTSQFTSKEGRRVALCNEAINKGDEVCVGVRRLQLIPLKRKATDKHFFKRGQIFINGNSNLQST